MNRRLFLLATTALAVSGAPALALSKSGQDFVTMAASSDMFEIESSKMALEKSQRDDVKAFAKMMVDDHGMASKKLKTVAQSQNMEVPAKMDPKHAQMVEKLKSADAAAFDAAYVEMQMQGHREAVDLFTAYGEGGDNPELKQFAQTMLPDLTTHLNKIEQIGGKA